MTLSRRSDLCQESHAEGVRAKNETPGASGRGLVLAVSVRRPGEETDTVRRQPLTAPTSTRFTNRTRAHPRAGGAVGRRRNRRRRPIQDLLKSSVRVVRRPPARRVEVRFDEGRGAPPPCRSQRVFHCCGKPCGKLVFHADLTVSTPCTTIVFMTITFYITTSCDSRPPNRPQILSRHRNPRRTPGPGSFDRRPAVVCCARRIPRASIRQRTATVGFAAPRSRPVVRLRLDRGTVQLPPHPG